MVVFVKFGLRGLGSWSSACSHAAGDEGVCHTGICQRRRSGITLGEAQGYTSDPSMHVWSGVVKMKTYGIFELGIVVVDAQRSADFYVDVVGFEYAPFDSGPGKGSRALAIGDSQYMGLWEPGYWNSTYWEGPYGHYFGDQIGQVHPVFGVAQEDVEPLAERLKATGHDVIGPMPHADGSLHLYFSDPDGHAVEMWGRQAP